MQASGCRFASLGLKGVFPCGSIVAKRAWNQSRTRFEDTQCGEFTAGQHVVTDRTGFDLVQVIEPLVEAFVPTADQEKRAIVQTASHPVCGLGLSKLDTSGAEGNLAMLSVTRFDPLDRFGDGLGLQHHAGTASKRAIIDSPVTVARPVAKIDQAHIEQSSGPGLTNDSYREVGGEGLGKEGKYGKERHIPSVEKAQQSSRASGCGQAECAPPAALRHLSPSLSPAEAPATESCSPESSNAACPYGPSNLKDPVLGCYCRRPLKLVPNPGRVRALSSLGRIGGSDAANQSPSPAHA